MQDQGQNQGHRPKAKAKAENVKVIFSSKSSLFRGNSNCNKITKQVSQVFYDNSNVGIQYMFTIIQYCIIYIIWPSALLFIPRPEHSRPENPKAKKFGLKAKAKD